MATTDKLGLYLPEGTDLVDPETAINDQMKIIDNNFKVEVCVDASELPVTPYDGQLAYREDVHQLFYWNELNGEWVFILGRKDAWGKKGYQVNITKGDDVGRNEEKGPYISLTFNQLEGRIYRVSWNMETDSPGGGDFGTNQLRVRYKFSTSVDVSDSLLYWNWLDHMNGQSTNSVSHSGGFSYTADRDAQVTLGVFLWRGNSSPTIYYAPGHDNNLMVEDIGWSDA